jgi:hypothetical protein
LVITLFRKHRVASRLVATPGQHSLLARSTLCDLNRR